jgi:hypothetical protein
MRLLSLIIFCLCLNTFAFAGENYFKGVCDASAAVVIGTTHLLVAEDEDDVLLLYSIKKPATAPISRFDFSSELRADPDRESDIEGAARVENRIYWITSHGRNGKGRIRKNRYRLFATDLSNRSSTVLKLTWVGSYSRLIRDALDKTSWESSDEQEIDATINFLGNATQLDERKIEGLAPKKNGLNIEALAALPDNRGLLIGLRNPLYHSKALVIHLKNPNNLVTNKSVKAIFGKPLYLDLKGLGLRSMAYNAESRKFLLIAGGKSSGGPFRLFEWDFDKNDSPDSIEEKNIKLKFSEGSHPEALFTYSSQIYVLHDEGLRQINGEECKKVNQEEKRFSFRKYDY